METGPGSSIYKNPMHPYSRALLSAVPRPDPEGAHDRRIRLSGDVPNPAQKPSGCAFCTRCPPSQNLSCADAVPPLEFKEGRWVACPLGVNCSRESLYVIRSSRTIKIQKWSPLDWKKMPSNT